MFTIAVAPATAGRTGTAITGVRADTGAPVRTGAGMAMPFRTAIATSAPHAAMIAGTVTAAMTTVTMTGTAATVAQIGTAVVAGPSVIAEATGVNVIAGGPALIVTGVPAQTAMIAALATTGAFAATVRLVSSVIIAVRERNVRLGRTEMTGESEANAVRGRNAVIAARAEIAATAGTIVAGIATPING